MERKYICNNGVPIYTYKNENLHSFHLSLFFKAGSLYESEEECGITHFFEHAAIRNVNRLMNGELYKLLDGRGVEFNASTYSEMCQFYTGGAVENFTFCKDIICKVLSPITLDTAEMDAERKRIKAEIRENDEGRSLSGIAAETVHEGTSLARSILGTVKSVNQINAKRLNEYREKIITRGNFFFYLTGNFDDADLSSLASEIEKYEVKEGEIRSNIAPVSQNFFKRGAKVHIKNSDCSSVRFTFDLDMTECPFPEGDLIYDVLFNGYSSPFFIKMSEEEGLFYDITSSSERYKNIGNIAFSFEVKQRDIYRSVEMALQILRDFKSRALGEEELMKSSYVKNSEILLDDARELAFTFAYDNHIMELGYGSVEDRAKRYERITGEQIKALANKIFTADNLTVVIKARKRNMDIEKIKALVYKYL